MQRFGGAINLNVHLHDLVCDGVFTRATAEPAQPSERDPERRATFHRLRGPTSEEVSELAMNVAFRFLAWCRKRGLVHDDLPDEDQGNDQDATSPIDACQRVALQLGTLGTPPKRPRRAGDPADPSARGGGTPHPDTPEESDQRFRRTKGPHSGAYERWDVHAGVMIPEGDHADRTHVLLEPMQLLARLAALVPPPRHPLIRFHGAFAPNSTWRKHVIPLTPPRLAGEKHAREPAPPARTSTNTSASTPRPRRKRPNKSRRGRPEQPPRLRAPIRTATPNPQASAHLRAARNGTSTGPRCCAACTT